MKYSIDEILEIVKRDGDFEYDLLEMGKIWGYRSLRFNFHRRFKYDFETGKLFYRYKPNGSKKNIGDEAGSLKSEGYLHIKFYNKLYENHRIIMIMFNDNFEDILEVDHIDGNKINNKLENLRMVSHRDNARNCRIFKHNKSGESGIYWDKKINKWKVSVSVNRKPISGGSYKDMDCAIKARDELYEKHGFHPNHGKR